MIDAAELAAIIRAAVAQACAPLDARIADLERQAAHWRNFGYVGVWQPDREYLEGNVATRSGAMWHANRPTTARPGSDSSWTLCVKSHRRGGAKP